MSSFESPGRFGVQLPGAGWFSDSWIALALVAFSVLIAAGYAFQF
jgi:hypothetical protein